MRFEALEQTLRLRLVSGPVDKKFFFISRNSLSRTVYRTRRGVSSRNFAACQAQPGKFDEENRRRHMLDELNFRLKI